MSAHSSADPKVSLASRVTPRLRELTPVWSDASDGGKLICCAIRQETHDVKSFFFRNPDGAPFRFLPGQFLTFFFEIDSVPLQRCYTISSPPTRPDTLSITVKRTPGGAVSNWLHDRLRLGDALRALGPSGEFTCALQPADKYLFLTGGSGITPLMSMARCFDDLQEDPDLVFVHAARTPADIIFRDELAAMAQRRAGMRNEFVCENVDEQAQSTYRLGRLTPAMLHAIAPDFLERAIFCCGPTAFMTAVREMLAAAGHDPRRYSEESFLLEEGGAVAVEPQGTRDARIAAPTPHAEKVFSVHFSAKARTIHCAADQTILDAARAAGIRLPYSCTEGKCGACKSTLLAGKVDMRHGGGIRQGEIDRGMILVCCSRPLSDVIIDR